MNALKDGLIILGAITFAILIYIGITFLFSGIINHNFDENEDFYIGAWFVGGCLFVATIAAWASTIG